MSFVIFKPQMQMKVGQVDAQDSIVYVDNPKVVDRQLGFCEIEEYALETRQPDAYGKVEVAK